MGPFGPIIGPFALKYLFLAALSRHRKDGVLKARTWVWVLIGVLLSTSASTAGAQGKGRRWGIGTFLSYNIPMFALKDRFSATSKYGASWQVMLNPKLYMEAEYHRSRFLDGKLAKKPFTWAVDQKQYLSPLASSEMKFNSLAVNLLIFHPEQPTFRAKDFVYYIEVGVGFYGYRGENRNFIFPGQTATPLDQTLFLQPQVDAQTALAINAGFGVQAFVWENVAVDLRARYSAIMGELRPMYAWGVKTKTIPLQLFDIGAGLKLYFWKG